MGSIYICTKIIVSAIPISFSIKRSNDTKINNLSNNHVLIFFLSYIESYMRIGPVVDYPKTVDHILERNLMKCQQTKTAIFTFTCQNWCSNAIILSENSAISIHTVKPVLSSQSN